MKKLEAEKGVDGWEVKITKLVSCEVDIYKIAREEGIEIKERIYAKTGNGELVKMVGEIK